jgi:hypothetical protein
VYYPEKIKFLALPLNLREREHQGNKGYKMEIFKDIHTYLTDNEENICPQQR